METNCKENCKENCSDPGECGVHRHVVHIDTFAFTLSIEAVIAGVVVVLGVVLVVVVGGVMVVAVGWLLYLCMKDM